MAAWLVIFLAGLPTPEACGSTPVVTGPFRAGAMAAGRDHSVALKADGTAVAWGSNTFYQRDPPSPNTNFIAVTAGELHTLGLKADGSVVGWGRNDEMQLLPASSNTGFVAVAAGALHSVGLREDGTLAAWGGGGSDQTNAPVTNVAFMAIASGREHSLALTTGGVVVAWGNNTYGQSNPPPTNEGFVAVAGGQWHSLALRADGRVEAWGRNDYDQLEVPSNELFVAIAAGYRHSVGLRPDGSVTTWGDTNLLQGAIPPDNSNFVAIAANGYHSLALRADGTMAAWGRDSDGQATVSDPNENFGIRDPVAAPERGSAAGGYPVSVHGYFLAGDVTNVTLVGIPASILSQSATQILVTAGAAPGAGLGDIRVFTSGSGELVASNAFRYLASQTIDFPPIPDQRVTSVVHLAATASSGLPVSFMVVSGPALISGGTNMTFSGEGDVRVVASQEGDDTWGPAVPVTNAFTVGATFLLEVYAGPGGSATPATGPQAEGALVEVTAIPDAYYHFTNWIGDVPAENIFDNPISVLMDGPKSVTAVFAPDTTSGGVPIPWLVGYGITSNFEQAVLDDPDADQVATGDEYIADTDPTNGTSYLTLDLIDVFEQGGGSWHVLAAEVSTGRVYRLEYKLPAVDRPWVPALDYRNVVPVDNILVITNGPAIDPSRQYRLKVRLP